MILYNNISESFFDDIENDVYSNNDTIDLVYNSVSNDIYKEANALFKLFSRDSNLYELIYDSDNNTAIILVTNSKNYAFIPTIMVNSQDLHLVLKFFDKLYDLNCKALTTIPINISSLSSYDCTSVNTKYNEFPEFDFHNIDIKGSLSIKGLTIKNLNISQLARYQSIILNSCNLKYQDTVQIYTSNLILEICVNMKDYSFIKECRSSLEIRSYNQLLIPKSCNYTGLPKGTYNLTCIYGCTDRSIYNDIIEKMVLYTETNSLVGIPETLTSIKIHSYLNPINVLSHFSFEGYTQILFDITEFKFGSFRKYLNDPVILIGPYKIQLKQSWFKMGNKNIIDYILKSHDYFVDAYTADNPSTKVYTPPTDVDSKLLNKAENILKKKLQNIDDKNNNLLKMILLAQKYLVKDSVWHGKYTYIKIKGLYHDRIEYTRDSLRRLSPPSNITQSYPKFFKWVSTHGTSLKRSSDNKTIVELVIDPVLKSYEKLKEKRKILDKLLKELDKQLKSVKQEKTTVKQEEKPKETEKSTVKLNTKPKIEIIDYSDKSIAIFGNTYDIKDKLKELGAKFNPFLKYNENTKKPGWIISKRKQKDVDDLINNL